MAELAIDRMLARNSLDRPVGFHWLAIVDAVAAMDTVVADTAVAGTAVAGTVVAGTAAGTVVDIAAVDIAASTVVVDSFVAAANRRQGWKLGAASTARLESDVRGLDLGRHAENPP